MTIGVLRPTCQYVASLTTGLRRVASVLKPHIRGVAYRGGRVQFTARTVAMPPLSEWRQRLMERQTQGGSVNAEAGVNGRCRRLALLGVWLAMFLAEALVNAADDTGDGKLVRFELVDEEANAQLILDVPAKYLNRRARRGPKNGLLVIETRLPDFRPRPAFSDRKAREGTPQAEAEDRYTRDGVIVQLQGKVMSDQYPVNVMRDFPARRDRLLDTVPGLRRFGYCDPETRSPRSSPSHDSSTLTSPLPPCRQINIVEDYFPEAYVPGEPWAHFHCERLDLNPNGRCRAWGLYRGRDFGYSIRRTELARWQEFDRGARQLLDRFVVSDSLRH